MKGNRERWKRAVSWGLLVLILLASAEVGAFVLTRLRPNLFDYRDEVFRKFRPEDLQRYKATIASNTLGWDNPAGVQRRANCIGREVTYSFDAARTRRHGKRSPQEAVVVVTGDSYTEGSDVADEETYPAALERILDVGVANLGVGGYGSLQALLKLESLIDQFPHARVAVLSIFSDDTPRMMNSFRPVYNRETRFLFGFQPHWRDGVIHDLVERDPLRDFETMRVAAEAAFDTDYWRRPVARFPYTAAVAQLLFLPSFHVQLLTRGQNSPSYEAVHGLNSARADLRALFDRFEAFTRKRGLSGVVVFIPASKADQVTGAVATSAASAAQREALTFAAVTIKDWTEFSAGPGPRCHPSAKGYAAIAGTSPALCSPCSIAGLRTRRARAQLRNSRHASP